MSLWSRGALLVGRIFNCACVGDVCLMTPRTENKSCCENSFCSMLNEKSTWLMNEKFHNLHT